MKYVTSGYRAINKKFIKIYAEEYAQDYPEPGTIVDAAVNKGKILEYPVIMQERANEESSISSLKSIYYIIKVSLSIVLYRLTLRKRDDKVESNT